MKKLAILSALALSACATDQATRPAIEVHTVVKTVEVQRPCAVAVPQRPAPIPRPLPTDAIALAATLAIKLREYAAPGNYADQADTALKICTKP